jgi:hypothetical protein
MLTVDPRLNIIIDRGDDQTYRATVVDADGVVVNVAAGSFKFTVKAGVDDAIADAVFQLTSPAGSGIDLTLAASGIVDVNIPAASVEALEGAYVYDLQMTLAGKVRTVVPARVFFVRKDVSTPGTAGSSSVPGQHFPGYLALDGVFYWLGADSLYHKMQIALDSDSGQYLLQDTGQNATYPF